MDMNNSKKNILMFAVVVATVAVRATHNAEETGGNPGSVATERAFPQLVHRNPSSPNGIKLAPLTPQTAHAEAEVQNPPQGKRSSRLRQAVGAAQETNPKPVSEGSAKENVPNTGQNGTVSRIRQRFEAAARYSEAESAVKPGQPSCPEDIRVLRSGMLTQCSTRS